MIRLNRNIRVLFIVGLSFGFVAGLSELVLPFFLSYRGVSLVQIGIIFSISALAMALFRIFLGEYTDIYGRKKVYSTAFAVGALSNALFPFSFGQIVLSLNKILTDISTNITTSIHSVTLYENDKENYSRWFSWITAGQILIMALGDFVTSILILRINFSGCFYLLAAVQAAAFFFFLLFYREKVTEKQNRKISLKKTFSFYIHRNLKVLAVASTLLMIGIQINHTFTLPLYFAAKYGMNTAQVAIIMAIHRLSFLTIIYASSYLKKFPLKKAYIYTSLPYVFSFLIVGTITLPIDVFTPIWLIHDLLGGGINATTQQVIVQTLARDDRRGKDVNTFSAIQNLSLIITPYLAGTLAAMNWDYIFLGGGILCLASVIFFCIFYKEE